MPTHYHDGGIAPRSNTYPYGAGNPKKSQRMKPPGRKAKQRGNGLMVRRLKPTKPRRY